MPHRCTYTCVFLSVPPPSFALVCCCSVSLALRLWCSFCRILSAILAASPVIYDRHRIPIGGSVSLPLRFYFTPTPPAVLGSSGSVALLASHSIAQSSSSSRDVIRRRFCSWLASTSTIPFAVASLCTPLSISFAFLLSIVPHGPSFSLDVPFPFYFLLFTTSRVKPFAPLLRVAYDRRTKSPRS